MTVLAGSALNQHRPGRYAATDGNSILVDPIIFIDMYNPLIDVRQNGL